MDIEINDYEILDRANQFRDAVEILKKSNKLIPTELNACLACELYLKYLVYFEKDNIQTKTKNQLDMAIHDLKELYDKCGDGIKIQIKEKMDGDFETKEMLINNYLQNIPSCAILSSNISNCIGGKNGYTC